MEEITMPAVRVCGPDDVYAVPDLEVANAVCTVLNWQFNYHPLYFDPIGIGLKAEVIQWPYSSSAWSEEKGLFMMEAIPAK